MMDAAKDYWPILMALLAFVVWLVRLEAKGFANEREIKRLWLQRREDLEIAREARMETNARLDVIAADIKQLLRAGQH